AVKWHRIRLRIKPRVAHHLWHCRISRALVWPFDPREDYRLAVFRLHGTSKISQLAVFHIISPALQDAYCAMLQEGGVTALGMLDELLFVSLRDCDYKSVDVAHVFTPAGKHRCP